MTTGVRDHVIDLMSEDNSVRTKDVIVDDNTPSGVKEEPEPEAADKDLRTIDARAMRMVIDEMWRVYDKDNSGFLEYEETLLLIKDITGAEDRDELNEMALMYLFNKADADGS